MEKLTGSQLADKLTDYVNTFSTKEQTENFIDGFCRQHNTLQQSSFKLMLALMEHMATSEYRTDGRNHASQQIARKLLAGFKKVIYDEEISMGISEESAKKNINSEYMKPSAYLPFI